MKKHLIAPTIIATISVSILLSSCTETLYSSSSSSETNHLVEQPAVVRIDKYSDLQALFDKIDYSDEMWRTGSYAIPRITFNSLGNTWAKNSQQLPVDTKKSIFFRLMIPLILVANENIQQERHIIQSTPLDAQKLIKIAVKYRVVENEKILLTELDREQLLMRVNIIPASLALVQAAEESGWGTSRFALEGNALFGQWDYSGNGMKPERQREEKGNYGVARFDNPLASVEAYMFNLNTNAAYSDLRDLRATLTKNNQQIKGYALAPTLHKYSERGEDYTNGIRQMIRFNKLQVTDKLVLSSDKHYHLIGDSFDVKKIIIIH